MPILNPNSTNYEHPWEPNLADLHVAMDYDADGKPVLRVAIGSDININGDVNIPGTVTVNSTPADPVHTHITEVGTSGVLTTAYLPVGGTVTVNQPVAVTDNNGSLTVDGSVSVSNFPATYPITDNGGSITVDGTVTATISDVITVIVDEDAGANYSFNNHAAAVHRGWVMDDTMRPVVSVRVTDTGTTTADIIKIIGYEIGNNNANQSTIVYEWYEGPLTFSGAAIPAWTNLGTKIQYRIYQDRYQSNQGNTFTVPVGTHMRHSGIVIGKNSEDDEESESLYGGATPNMLTLCMKRVDNSTELDVWFAFTIKELA